MKKEKIILSFTAALIGILVAGASFFIYQSTRKVDTSDIKKITIGKVAPSPASSVFLTVERPRDEEVVDKRVITVTGKTIPEAKIVILTQTTEEAGVAASNGNFSMEITLDKNENIIEISAIAPNGEIAKVKKVVIFTTESF